MSTSARPMVTVQAVGDAAAAQLSVPAVLLAPIRTDVVHFVHTNIAKNARQPYAVSLKAGHQHSAESWGTGRAVSRVPRVSGSGTHRAGQAAFTNQSRKGRMFAPTKTWRKWHRKVAVGQRRYAVVSALAASAVPSLVEARGHRVAEIPEIPLVVSAQAEQLTKTKDALALLNDIGCGADVDRAKASRKIRSGVGKIRGRRHVQRRGPLIVYNNDEGITRAFRNLPGVELCQVDRLNLLQLAPGGHLGRLIVWTAPAFERLDSIFGGVGVESETKSGFRLPRSVMTNPDLSRLINSDEVQSVLRDKRTSKRAFRLKKNPLKNFGAMLKLNPYAMAMRRAELLLQEAKQTKRAKTPAELKKQAAQKKHRPAQKSFYNDVLLN